MRVSVRVCVCVCLWVCVFYLTPAAKSVWRLFSLFFLPSLQREGPAGARSQGLSCGPLPTLPCPGWAGPDTETPLLCTQCPGSLLRSLFPSFPPSCFPLSLRLTRPFSQPFSLPLLPSHLSPSPPSLPSLPSRFHRAPICGRSGNEVIRKRRDE